MEVEFCSACKEQVVRYEGEEGCPFCGGPVTDLGSYIDSVHDTYKDRGGIPRSSNGRTADFESANGGSNPPRGSK